MSCVLRVCALLPPLCGLLSVSECFRGDFGVFCVFGHLYVDFCVFRRVSVVISEFPVYPGSLQGYFVPFALLPGYIRDIGVATVICTGSDDAGFYIATHRNIGKSVKRLEA